MIRRRLKKVAQRKGRKSWYIGARYTILDTMTRFGIVATWQDLPWTLKRELMAKGRADDTMQAWESYLITRGTR